MMYYPYLRGKQYELISLRGLKEFVENKNIICPIIEPVKFGSTLVRTIETLLQNNYPFIIVLNPEYGDYKNKSMLECWEKLKELLEDKIQFIHFAFLANRNYSEIYQLFAEKSVNRRSVIFKEKTEITPDLYQIINKISFQSIIMEDNRDIRRLTHGLNVNKIVISDRFNLKERNVDYLEKDDEFFTNDHIYYNVDGYDGFSDYVTIGDNYSDKGFLPYAVAIHWTYLDNQDFFRIHHFVSDSNEDNTDVPGKFWEALCHLIEFANNNNLPETYAMREMRKYYESEDYPGLGVLKKLSILNHLELIYNYFNK